MRNTHKLRSLLLTLIIGFTPLSYLSTANAGAAGVLGGAIDLPPLTLSLVEPMATEPYELVSGQYYRIVINCDGSGELAISGAEFFRNVWVNEVVINDIEIRPLGLDSIEFDDEGSVRISFVAITPGQYTVRIPHTTGESQQAVFTIK